MERDFETVLVEQCAPTLAGIKPANLFCFRGLSPTERSRTARRWDGILSESGLRLRIVKVCPHSGSFLAYVYRPDWLERLLSDRDVSCFLKELGYRDSCVTALLVQLSRRLCLQKEFPHEIGIFLGYPLRDVVGFIENGGQNFTFSGYWKSYGDPAEAMEYFERCRKCRETYSQLHQQGTPLLSLVVAA